MIVATAGHVDHGKTSLVRALTGVDTDRLEEEKRRGLSIDLGFAYADFGADEPIGFVDVPGHERFVRNMLAGVGAIDFALLVVAADDGPMPQTLEHLAILRLLGITHGAVALTKIDRVDSARQAAATAEIRALLANSPLLADSPLRDAPIWPVAATIGQGVAAIRDGLSEAARRAGGRAQRGLFRLSVDRAFSLAGAGLVVTGAVHAGRVSVGDQIVVSPHGIEARIRGIHANNRPSPTAQAGQRCSLNLAGVELRKLAIERGDWILEPSLHAPTARIDVRVDVLIDAPPAVARALTDSSSVQLHLAATSVRARIALLGAKSISPGHSALAQLVLERPIVALHGDRFVLRDQAAQRTIGGGTVVDPFAPARGRAKPARLTELAALQLVSASASLTELLAAKTDGVDLAQFERARNLDAAERLQLRQAVALQEVQGARGPIAIAPARWRAQRAQLLDAIAAYHREFSNHVGMRERTGDAVSNAALRALIAEGAVLRDGLHLRLPTHQAQLAGDQQALWRKIESILRAADLRPPIIGELAKQLAVEPARLLSLLQQAEQLGFAEQVAPNRYFLPETIASLVRLASELAGESADGSFDAATYRDRSGIGRNLTIQVLEYLDRNGFTRFARERRWLRAG